MASAVIFFVNALLSMVQGYWLLSLLQAVTASMAALAALYSGHARAGDGG